MAYSDEFFTLDLGAELTKKISLDTIDQMQSESFVNLFLPFQYKSYKDISSSVCHNKLLDKIRLIYKKSFFPLNEDASLFFTSEDTQCDLASGDTRDMINTLSQMQITKVYKALMLLKLRADAANYDNLVRIISFVFVKLLR